MNYYHKYIKYKTKYLSLKNQSGGKNNNKIICELHHLAIYQGQEKGEEKEWYENLMTKECLDSMYLKYHTKWVPGSQDAPENKQTLTSKVAPFKFKNSLGDYLSKLYKENKLKKIGSFNSKSDQLIVCGDIEEDMPKEERDKYVCLAKPASKGEYNVYFVDSNDHWNDYGPDGDQDWEKAGLVMHDSISFKDLDDLLWHKDILYAHGACGVFPYDDFGDVSTLDPKMIHAKKVILDDNQNGYMDLINNMYVLRDFKDKYIMLPTAVTFDTHESRPRLYVYGMNSKNKMVAVFLHSLY